MDINWLPIPGIQFADSYSIVNSIPDLEQFVVLLSKITSSGNSDHMA